MTGASVSQVQTSSIPPKSRSNLYVLPSLFCSYDPRLTKAGTSFPRNPASRTRHNFGTNAGPTVPSLALVSTGPIYTYTLDLNSRIFTQLGYPRSTTLVKRVSTTFLLSTSLGPVWRISLTCVDASSASRLLACPPGRWCVSSLAAQGHQCLERRSVLNCATLWLSIDYTSAVGARTQPYIPGYQTRQFPDRTTRDEKREPGPYAFLPFHQARFRLTLLLFVDPHGRLWHGQTVPGPQNKTTHPLPRA